MSKTFIIAAIIIVILGGVVYLQRQTTPVAQEEVKNPEVSITSENTPITTESAGAQSMETEKETVTIRATDSGFVPSSVSIKKGATVVFMNESSRDVWIASAMHPTHTVYPTKGGCIGSTFDACRGLKPNESWSFTFDIAGAWKYHDHLSPGNFGSITVE